MRQWNVANQDKVRDGKLKRKFGITIEHYNMMFEQQNGSCAICNRHQSEFKRALAVDHDHKSGKVRALLCLNCNKSLGGFQERPELLHAAVAYLESHRGVSA